MTARRVTLHGTLTGQIWMPATEAQLPLTVDLLDVCERGDVGLVEAIKAAVDEGSGDFRSARLTADSFVLIEHSRPELHGELVKRRTVDVTDLPSLADYVAPDSFAIDYYEGGEE